MGSYTLITERFNMIDASIPLQVQVPDIGKAVGLYYDTLNRNKEMKMKQEQSALRNQLVNRQMEKINKDEAVAENERIEMSMVAGAQTAQKLMDDNNISGALTFLKQRAGEILDSGRDASDTINAIQNLEAGNYDQVRSELGTIVDYGMNKGLISRPGIGGEGSTANMKDYMFFNEIVNNPNSSPDEVAAAQVRLKTMAAPQGDVLTTLMNSRNGDTLASYLVNQSNLASAKTQGGDDAARLGGFIDLGISAADSTINTKRTIDLLNSIKTGGFEAVALKAKNLLGIEGANEAELTNNLVKSVISQYREVFGAQFTEGEGKKLDRAEAAIGKSTAGNIRILNTVLDGQMRKVRRGKGAAKELGNDFALDEINRALNYQKEKPKDKELSGNDKTAKSAIDELDKRMSAARGG
jgi:hypothetical protein